MNVNNCLDFNLRLFSLRKCLCFTLFLLIVFSNTLVGKNSNEPSFRENVKLHVFDLLPSISNSHKALGLAGSFSGIIGDHLVIGGGCNFPSGYPWDGAEKIYYGDVYVRDLSDNGSWVISENMLPSKLAYGVSISLPSGILLIGGSNSNEISSEVTLLSLVEGKVSFEQWPALPMPLTNMSGVLINDAIYIAGGVSDVKIGATNLFLTLDINDLSKGWRVLESWTGPARAFSVSAGQSNGVDQCFYLFSGRDFGQGKDMTVLEDGYEYNIRLKKWRKIEGVSFPFMAGLAVPSGNSHIYFIGGADKEISTRDQRIKKGEIEGTVEDFYRNHPGFSSKVYQYHTITNTITESLEHSKSLPVTSNIVKGKENEFYIVSGEMSPGIRTPEILKLEISREKQGMGVLNVIVISLYFIVLAGMGWFFSRRQKNSDDYFKGGGRLPWWAVGLSIFGTALSAITFMAIPAKAYATDWSYIILNAGIILVVPLITMLFIPFYRRLNITTAYEYLEKRFNLAVRLICAVSFIVFQVGRMGVVLLLPSIALNVVTGIDIMTCIVLMGVLSLVYTMMGGIEAVVWTDALQVVILMGGAFLAVFYIVSNVDGGFGTIISQGMVDRKFALPSLSFDFRNPTIWTIVLATIFTNITTYGTDQTMVQRYLTTKDEKMAKQSLWLSAALCIPASLLFFFVGTCLYVFYKSQPILLSTTIIDGDAIFPWFIYTEMGDGVSGLLIAGIFAAAMSTLSSSMNSAATSYAVDIHFRFGWSKNKDQLKMAKIFTCVIGIIGILFAVFMATLEIQSLWDEFQKILGLILGGLGGLFLLAMLTRRANSTGALIGIITSVIVQIIMSKTGIVHFLLYAATGFVSCFVVGYISSLFFKSNKDIRAYTIFK